MPTIQPRPAPRGPARAAIILAFGLLVVVVGSAQPAFDTRALGDALTFHASFDAGLDADYGRGDQTLYSASSRKAVANATPGAPAEAVARVPGGRYGDAVRIRLKSSPLVFYRGAGNIAYSPRDWSGTVSVWFSLDPDKELAPGYSDPLIITPRAWDDASLFVDFTRDDVPRRFRFAAFADKGVWNPSGRQWETVPVAERPMIEITGRRFAAGAWTHVAWTWERFNTGRPDGVVRAYLDGVPVGVLAERQQTYTWNPADVLVAFGVEYIGLMDELAIFDGALTADQIRALHQLPGGLAGLRPR